MKNSESNRGFALLYALLVISVTLLITTSIFSILLKEVRLASFGKSSQLAYYAAETGAECALYWSVNGAVFDGTQTIQCARGDDPSTGYPIAGGQDVLADTDFYVYVNNDGACARIEVTTGANITIQSRGYNICPTIGGSHARRVERGLELTY